MGEGTPLQTSFCFSYMRRGKGGSVIPTTKTAGAGEGSVADNAAAAAKQAATIDAADKTTTTATPTPAVPHPYEDSIKVISVVDTVEAFWNTYDFLKRPNELPTTTDYHFFRDGIKPTWEDPSNVKGGKWIVRLPKGLASRYWEEIILATIGGQFTGLPENEVCGAVLSVRYSEDILGVWNRTAADPIIVSKIRDSITKVLQLPPQANMEYKPHNQSLQDRSSFRNTQVWKSKSRGGHHSQGDRDRGGGGEGGGPGESSSRGGYRDTRRSSSFGERDDLGGRNSKRDSDRRAWR